MCLSEPKWLSKCAISGMYTSTAVLSLGGALFSLAVQKEQPPVEQNPWASAKNRLCKRIYTGGSYKKTGHVNGLFTMAVCIMQPPV
jgi:hypothetical protein